MLIALEGQDLAGKGTLADGLVKYLNGKGKDVLLTSDLYHTEFGINVRLRLLDPDNDLSEQEARALLTQARIVNCQERIIPCIKANGIAISDRFHLSTWAYQYPFSGLSEEEFAEQCEKPLPILPDLVFYLDLSPEQARQRAAGRAALDKFEKRGDAYFTKVRETYQWLAKRPYVVTIDASQSREAILGEAIRVIESRFPGLRASGFRHGSGRALEPSN
ncbi:dTMP kinase [Pseudomonas aeruginosa]